MMEQKIDPQPRFLNSNFHLLPYYSCDVSKKNSCVQMKLESSKKAKNSENIEIF